jgi:hypothetical protein
MLDRQYGELAEKFEHLYSYCLRKTRDGEFEHVKLILVWLRTSSDGAPTAPSYASP